MKKYALSLILTAIIISSCSNKQVYENIQQNAQRECRKLPTPDYQKCMEHYSENFELYTQKRENILK